MQIPELAQGLTWHDLSYLAPELMLVAAAILITLMDLALPRRLSGAASGALSLFAILLSLGLVVWRMIDMNGAGDSADGTSPASSIVRLLGDSYRIDDFANLMKIVFLVSGALIALLAIGHVRRDAEVTDKGEYFTLLLPALTGAMIVASSGDLVTLFVGLELLSITTYVLVGIRKNVSKSTEASFKYIVVGSISSAMMLFGMSYLYGVTGSTNLGGIAQGMQQAVVDYRALLYVGFFFLIGGLAIKIAAAPFHAWAPDVYQGSSIPVAAFLAVVSKGAALAVLFRIVFSTALFHTTQFAGPAAGEIGDDVFLALQALAAAAMIAGTTAALRQRNMKRLLALSGVANAGYLMVPIAIGIADLHTANMGEFWYYLVAYLFMTIGAFAVLSVVGGSAGHYGLGAFAGLYYRAPWTAAAMIALVLSLAGLPVSGGFLGKLFILMGAASSGDYWLLAIMVATSVISYYFYFAIVRQMFMRAGDEAQPVRVPASAGIVIWLCACASLALGLLPAPLLDMVDRTFSLLSDLFVHG